MRSISKRSEPTCVANLRREAKRVERETGKPTQGEDWSPRDCGDRMREALCHEQHWLCAYCMRRIRPVGQNMKIEHFVPRSCDAGQMYDWGNLLGVCNGILRGPAGEVRICDTARGDAHLHIHPASTRPPRPEDAFRMLKNGRIDARTDEAKADCETLNLNCEQLVESRRAVINALREALMKDDSISAIDKMLLRFERPTAEGLPEHARLAVSYLERKRRSKHRK